MHPTSLPGPYGIGDAGPQARAFVDWLAKGKMRVWQVLPLVPLDLLHVLLPVHVLLLVVTLQMPCRCHCY